MSQGVWLVVGVQASGKTTVADGLARRFDRGVHVQGGQFYRWAVRGWVHHDDPRSDEARRHLDLRYRLSASTADAYCAEGFTTVVQDNLYGSDVVEWLERVHARPRHLVVLRPSLEVVAGRDAARTAATSKVAYGPGRDTIANLDALLDATPRLGLWIDSSNLSADETVDMILSRAGESIVDAAL
jgi:predicted kinase